MKSRTSTYITATILFAVLAVPIRLAAQHHRYKLIDLGTFGGPESYINPAFTFGSHHQVNHRGTVVGGSATSIPTTPVSNGFVCGGLDGTVPFVNHAFEWKRGTTTDLGALPGGNNCSVGTSINTRGEIVGVSENGAFDPVFGTNAVGGVLWKDGQIIDLGTLGGPSSSADEINGRGQVVGFALDAISDPVSIVYFGLAGLTNGTQTRAYLWEDGVMQDLGTLGGPDAVALFVNERGQVAGFSYTNSTLNPVTGLPTTHPFVWTKETGMKDLGSLGGSLGWANSESGGFNNRGEMIGISNVAGDMIAHPFLWDGEKLIDLNTATIGGNPVTANEISDAGEVIGTAVFPNGASDAYLWKDGAAVNLGTLPGDCLSEAFAINGRRQIIGASVNCVSGATRSFLWENGSMVDLSSLISSGSSLRLVETRAINDRGEIAGIGVPPGCTVIDTKCGHAFVLIPCDDDHRGVEGCDYSIVGTADVSNNAAPARQPLPISQPSASMMRMTNASRNGLLQWWLGGPNDVVNGPIPPIISNNGT